MRIQQAVNGLIYARSWYLDAMNPGWDALVNADYTAVLPVTWRSKLGIKYLCQPAFTQQLGLFCSHASQLTLLPDFLKALALRFRLIEVFLNHQNDCEGHSGTHANFVLSLQDDYATISGSYKQDLFKNLKRTTRFNLQYKAGTNAAAAVHLFREAYQQRLGARPQDYTLFTQCVDYMLLQRHAFIREVSLPGGELLATGIFARDERRIYNLASTTLPNGRMMEANHFLFDQLIREFAGSGLLLDFEGSDQPGIARFYQKFGSINQPYYFWKTNRLPAILRWWKR
jgi:hypothetical protein